MGSLRGNEVNMANDKVFTSTIIKRLNRLKLFAKRYPVFTSIAVIFLVFMIFSIFYVAEGVLVDPDHVVVTTYLGNTTYQDDKVNVTIDRVSYLPATKVRELFVRYAKSQARPEYIQIDGTIGQNLKSSGNYVLTGPATISASSSKNVVRIIRTRGNLCLRANWPTMALQLTDRPGDFTIRIPLSNLPDDASEMVILESIRAGILPQISLKGIYMNSGNCKAFNQITSTDPHEIVIPPFKLGSSEIEYFYPNGIPRFEDKEKPQLDRKKFWHEWTRGWVPGEF